MPRDTFDEEILCRDSRKLFNRGEIWRLFKNLWFSKGKYWKCRPGIKIIMCPRLPYPSPVRLSSQPLQVQQPRQGEWAWPEAQADDREGPCLGYQQTWTWEMLWGEGSQVRLLFKVLWYQHFSNWMQVFLVWIYSLKYYLLKFCSDKSSWCSAWHPSQVAQTPSRLWTPCPGC